MADQVGEKLEHWKGKLIDLSKRNRLIKFRPTKLGTIHVVGELPPEIYRILVGQQGSMTFSPMTEGDQGETKTYASYSKDDLAGHHTDRVLQTDLPPEQLDRALIEISRKASSIQEEHGYNTLYLALGLLEWYESSSSQELIRSPILLVPVELTRKSVRSPFRLSATDEDPVINPSLQQALQAQFRIQLPTLGENPEGLEIQELFDEVARETEGLDRMRVTNSVHLGLFSFTKFVMYKDLITHSETFLRNPLVRLLAGDQDAFAGAPEAATPSGEELDRLALGKSYQIMDADSSQQEAIEAVKAGRSLVIEGPPGTGKSQTITNVIGECLMAGKRVLFVSEKMAALNVVHSRLQSAGLGDFCLELHSQKTSKKRVVEELARTLELPRNPSRVSSKLVDDVMQLRDDLNRYVIELRTPVQPLGDSPYHAFGVLASHAATPEVPVFIKGAMRWTRGKYDEILEVVRALAQAREGVDPAGSHPWRGSTLCEISYEHELAIKEALHDVIEISASVQRAAEATAEALDTRVPRTLPELEDLIDLATLLMQSPKPERAVLTDPRWAAEGDRIRRLLKAGADVAAGRDRLRERFDDGILREDLAGLLDWWKRHGEGLFRFLRPAYWKYRSLLKAHAKTGPEFARVVDDMEEFITLKRLLEEVKNADGTMFGRLWKQEESPWTELEALAGWMFRFQKHLQSKLASDRCLDLAERGFESVELPDIEGLKKAWRELADRAGLNVPLHSLAEASEQASEMLENAGRLHEWVRYRAALRKAEGSEASGFVSRLEALPPDRYAASFERQFYRSWIEEVLQERRTLGMFDGRMRDKHVRTFSERDRQMIHANRLRARAALLERLPDSSWDASPQSDLGILQREVRKKRAHLPVRKLLDRVANSLARLKPCFLMSPLSVAQYVDPAGQPFDVTVFDEASQIPPEDALGVIARSKQVVVVGDSKQLPPTSFFQVETPPSESDEADDFVESDLESVLDECATLFPERRMLRWHYRSLHESLITFSNRLYYANRLYTFPSPEESPERLGVHFVRVEDGVYDRGGSGTNRIEAERVADAVLEYMRRNPRLSVGIGTFGIRQQGAIQDALERRLKEDPELESRFLRSTEEYCFVKNLETIQGDERDTIFLSVGYGRDNAGKMSMNFGPLNQAGGTRRLNVLVTRARRQLYVFSSILPEDIDLARTEAEGVHNLRLYLEFARKGPVVFEEKGDAGREASESPFEQAVYDALSNKGVRLVRQVGCSGYRIDMAVVDKGRYVLGIECDGATYHDSATARDRDRLRQDVLSSLGWKLHRIWSTDWFRNPNRELMRALTAIKEAGEAKPTAAPRPSVSLDALQVAGEETGGPGEDVIPYSLYEVAPIQDGSDFYTRRPDQLSALLVPIVRQEGPIHKDEAARRVAAHWNLSRLGSTILSSVQEAAKHAQATSKIFERGDFYWPQGMKEPPVRSRNGPEDPQDIELIAPQEIAAALLLVLRKEYRVHRDDLVDRAARVLGFSRTGVRVRESVEEAVKLIQEKGLASGSEWLQLGATPEPHP